MKWKLAYYCLNAFILVTIGAAFLFSRSISSDYKAAIQIDNYWSTTITHLVELNDTIIAANMPGNEVFDSLDPVLERHHKDRANLRFRETISKLRKHLANTPNHLKETTKIFKELDEIESQFRILDARAQVIFDTIAMGQTEIASSVMATMDRTASDCSSLLSQTIHSVNKLQKEDFKAGQKHSESLSQYEYLILTAVGLIVIIGIAFGRKIFIFLNALALEAETSRRKADKARHELSSQTFALDQHSIVAITDTAGHILYVNDKFCEISKYPREELLGKDHRVLNSGFHPKQFFAEMYKTIAKGEVWRAEVKNKSKDGTSYWVDTTVVPYRDEAGRISSYVAIRTDITDRKRDQEKLSIALEDAKKSYEEAASANRAKSEFLATMSHEIRTPMNSVIGFSNLLLDANLPENTKNFARSILSSGQSLLAIINDILDISKIEAGKLDIETMPFDLKQTAEEAIELLAKEASEKQLTLLLNYDPALPRGFSADPGRVRQIIINLVGNAVKFTKSGHVSMEIAPDPRAPRTFARISVTDTGIGIPENLQNKLFTKFTQADSSTSRNFGGTGLGLAICKQLAEFMGGEIGLTSELGKGSTFWFTLPLSQTPIKLPEVSQPPERSGNYDDNYQNDAQNAPQGNFRILVVDDTALNQTLLRSILEQKYGYRVDTAANGQEAVAQYQEFSYDMLFMDCMMPIMDGFEATQKIREAESLNQIPKTPIIALTANALLGDDQKCYTAGMDDYLSKPINKHQLIAVLRRWLKPSPKTANEPVMTSAPNPSISMENANHPYLDIQRLQDMFPADSEIQFQILSSYQQTLTDLRDQTKTYKDLKELRLISHTLKGSSAECGALPLSKIAKQVEDACIDSSEDAIPHLLAEMENAMTRTLESVTSAIESIN